MDFECDCNAVCVYLQHGYLHTVWRHCYVPCSKHYNGKYQLQYMVDKPSLILTELLIYMLTRVCFSLMFFDHQDFLALQDTDCF